MKKPLLVVIGGIVAVIAFWLVSPLFIERRVEESVEDITGETQEETREITKGTFAGLAGHSGEGTARIIESGGKTYLRFEDDFRVTNGPDLFVHFGKDGAYDGAARIGALKGNVGGQNYEIPVDLDPRDFNEVWVWCRAFSVPFAKAEFK